MTGATQELLSMLKESNDSFMDQTIKKIEEQNIKEIYILFTDLHGTLRGKCINKKYFLNNINKGFGFDYYILTQTITNNMIEIPSIIPDISGDMIGIPDLKTFQILPHSKRGVVLLDLYWKNMEPILFYPRNKLKAIVAEYNSKGLIPKTGIELEFMIFRDKKPICELTKPYSIKSLINIQNITKDIFNFANSMDIKIESLSSEYEEGQYEIVLEYGETLNICDSLTMLKFLLESDISNKHNITCSFVAKFSKEHLGNGLHFHQSLWDSKNNLFSDIENLKLFEQYLAGNIKHTKSSAIFYFPNPNSYERLIKNSTAPTGISWGFDNRSVAFRIPEGPMNKSRIENRLPGSDACIYLVQIVALTAGLIGFEKRYELCKPSEEDVYKNTNVESLPTNMESALKEYKNDQLLRNKIGKELDTLLIAIKEKEISDFKEVEK